MNYLHNYNPNANSEDNSCITQISGCTDPLYLEYNENANVDNNSCSDLKVYGCTDGSYIEYWHYDILSGIYYHIGNAINTELIMMMEVVIFLFQEDVFMTFT